MTTLKLIAEVLVGYEDQKDGAGAVPVTALREVEVLTVHFTRHKMRVRYMADIFNTGKETVRTVDIDAAPFFDQYKIVTTSALAKCSWEGAVDRQSGAFDQTELDESRWK